MLIGHSKKRMKIKHMPKHQEIKDFALEVAKEISYKLVDEKKESRVVLLMKEDISDRKLKFD
jgi:wyosine [tRNA(Phe)-imidazoG37] synthetase (radical SAM superfamily)